MNRWGKFLALWLFASLVIWAFGGWLVAAMFFSVAVTMYVFYICWATMQSYRVIRDLIICPKCRFLLNTLITAEATGVEGTPDQLWCAHCNIFYEVSFKSIEMPVKSVEEK